MSASGKIPNDARGTTITVDPVTNNAVDRVDLLVRSTGAEVGIRANRSTDGIPLHSWYLSWTPNCYSLVTPVTPRPGPSRRYGIEFNNFFVLSDIWTLEADLAWTDAEFSDSSPDGNEIPGALPFVASGVLACQMVGLVQCMCVISRHH